MNVWLTLTTVTKLVPTLRVASAVAVTRDTDSTRMEGHAVVSARAQARVGQVLGRHVVRGVCNIYDYVCMVCENCVNALLCT